MVALYKYIYRHANYRYLEWWQPTMKMDDLKILTITKEEDLATYRDKLEKAWYKVIDLNSTTLEEKQAIIDANDDVKTKFILHIVYITIHMYQN